MRANHKAAREDNVFLMQTKAAHTVKTHGWHERIMFSLWQLVEKIYKLKQIKEALQKTMLLR